jgi:hypothetical protein
VLRKAAQVLVNSLENEMRAWLLKFGCLFLPMFTCASSVWEQAIDAAGPNRAADAAAVRVIRDPHNGICWLLERDSENPGGPGRMVLLNDLEGTKAGSLRTPVQLPMAYQGSPPLVIRSGDRLVIEEHSALVEARLEATSMGLAVQGAEFNARLAIGGKVVRAVALAPGLAAFASSEGAVQR